MRRNIKVTMQTHQFGSYTKRIFPLPNDGFKQYDTVEFK